MSADLFTRLARRALTVPRPQAAAAPEPFDAVVDVETTTEVAARPNRSGMPVPALDAGSPPVVAPAGGLPVGRLSEHDPPATAAPRAAVVAAPTVTTAPVPSVPPPALVAEAAIAPAAAPTVEAAPIGQTTTTARITLRPGTPVPVAPPPPAIPSPVPSVLARPRLDALPPPPERPASGAWNHGEAAVPTPAPVVEITIDRVELRLPRPLASSSRRTAPASLSLDDYLARRQEVSR